MKIFFKNQLKMIWKKWFSFIGIFILIFLSVFLTNSALNSRENANSVFTSLNQSNMYRYITNEFRSTISNKGFQTIENHFFSATTLTKDQKDLISDNQIITAPNSNANDEIQKWNYNFRAWLTDQELTNQFGKNNYQLAGSYSITNIGTINGKTYRIRLENGFNDNNWTFVNSSGHIENKYNFKTSDMIVLTQGRMPTTDNEIVISAFKSNNNYALNNIVTIDGNDYTIVGQGYNASNYIWSNSYNTDITVFLNNSNMNKIWLPQATNSNNARNNYFFINMNSNYYLPFMTNLNPNFTHPLNVIDYQDLLKNNIRFQLANVETLIFSIFGFVMFMISSVIITIFLKKELNSQKVSLGILMSLGVKSRTLALIMAISYITILFLPIILGFGASFGLQFYLTTAINKIMFIPNSFVIISVVPSIICLVILPLILGLTLTIVFLMLLSKPPLTLINHKTKMKPIKFKKYKTINSKFIRNLMNLRLTLAFAKSNSLRITSAVIIFFINIFVALFLLNFVYVYNYSTAYSNVSYTDKGNRLFNVNNPNINQLLDDMLQDGSYDDSIGNKIWHWVANEQFQTGIGDGTYHEITDFSTVIIDWYNTFVSPNTVKIIANNPALLQQVKTISEPLYILLVQAIPFWKAYDSYPYLTFGFKIYNPTTSIQYLTLKGKWETSLPFVNSQVYIVSYKTNDFPQWIKYQGANHQQSLIDFNVPNDNYINGIFPLQLAKQLHLKIGDIVTSRLTNDNVDTLPWSQIPVRVSGINNYNYFNQNVIVKQSLLVKYLTKTYENYETSIGNTSTIKITNDDNFVNDMLVADSTPEICRNVSLVNTNNQYNLISKITLNGSLLRYGITNYGEQAASVAIINSLVSALQTLTIIVLIIAVVIILVLVNLMFQENKKDIISLKILGYSNNRITSLIMIPYATSFMVAFVFSVVIIYFLLQVTLHLVFQIAGIWLLFTFSPILIIIFFFSITILMILAYILGHHQINNSRFNDVIMEN